MAALHTLAIIFEEVESTASVYEAGTQLSVHRTTQRLEALGAAQDLDDVHLLYA